MKRTKNQFSLLIISLLFISFAWAPAVVQAVELNQLAVEDTNKSISNFGYVSPDIWRGAVPSDQALERMKAQGLKTVIDLRYGELGCKHEKEFATKLGLKYVHFSMGFNYPDQNKIIAFLKIVNDPVNLPVYIHCRQGADRTGIFVGIYRILVQKWGFKKAYSEMRAYHFKPWLFGMKNRIAEMASNENTKKALQIALVNDNASTKLP